MNEPVNAFDLYHFRHLLAKEVDQYNEMEFTVFLSKINLISEVHLYYTFQNENHEINFSGFHLQILY